MALHKTAGIGSFRCIVADDSVYARKIISSLVGKLGGVVVGETGNGEEAVDLFAKFRPDLVFLDITMPVLDGVETLRKIMEKSKDAKVIMVSSLGHKEMILKSLALGAKHFVSKPYNAEHAGKIIKAVLNGESGGVG